MVTTNDSEKPRRDIRSFSVRPQHLVALKSECRRLGVKQTDFIGVLLRAWQSMDGNKQVRFIPSEPAEV